MGVEKKQPGDLQENQTVEPNEGESNVTHSVEPLEDGQILSDIASGAQTNMVEHSVSIASPEQAFPKNTVTVKINYPKTWKRERYFKDGDLKEVSQEVADQFIAQGFATLVKE